MSHEPDEVLIKRISDRDETAFQILYERHGLALLNYLMRLTDNRQQAEDVLQEVMLAVWKQAHSFRPVAEVRAWLFGIAKRQALKSSRRMHHHLPLHEEQIAHGSNMSNGVMKQLTLQSGIQALPAVEREALEMVYYRGMRLEEVAAALDVPLNTVKTRLYRARQRLHAYLAEENPDHAR